VFLVAERFVPDERPHTFRSRLGNAWGERHNSVRGKKRLRVDRSTCQTTRMPRPFLWKSCPRKSRGVAGVLCGVYRRFLFAAASAARMR
jgi:hypothetical protein